MSSEWIVKDDRVCLRPIQLADAESLHPIYCDPATMAFYRRPLCKRLIDTQGLIAKMMGGAESGVGIRWAICPAGHNEVVGSIGYHGWDKVNRIAYLSYEVVPVHRGRRWAESAGRVALVYGRRSMDLEKVLAIIDESNLPSIKTAQRLGFEVARAGERWTSGSNEDRLVFVRYLNV